MYNLERVRKEFTAICNKAGVQVTSPISLNGRLTRTLGRVCMVRRGDVVENEKVEFSKQLLETTTDATIDSVIKHEAAHYIVTARTHEAHGHDSLFKAVCAEIGTANDGTTTKVERTIAEDKIYKYSVVCPNCGIIGHYHRMSKNLKNISLCYCKTCNSHNLSVIHNF
jgi:predicted SprT family Zn-dependent metalloprotease